MIHLNDDLKELDEHRITRPSIQYRDYYDALFEKGDLRFEWTDKPHQLVHDLLMEIINLKVVVQGHESYQQEMAERVASLQARLDEMGENL